MPKQKITKEMVVNAAFELARAGGAENITVKSIAEKLSCSVQPIYSYCENMEGLRQEVAARAREFVRDYTAARIEREDLFRSTGRAYALLAKEEPNIFKLFILHQRNNISSLAELYAAETDSDTANIIAEELGIGVTTARELHLNMLIYTVGIGAIFAVSNPGIPPEEIFSQQEKAFRAFYEQALKEDNDNE